MPTKAKRRIAQRIGARVRFFREQTGLSVEKVAWAVRIDKSALSRIERGERSPSCKVLFALAKKLGVIAADLVGIGRDPRTRLLDATRGLTDEKVKVLLRQLAQDQKALRRIGNDASVRRPRS